MTNDGGDSGTGPGRTLVVEEHAERLYAYDFHRRRRVHRYRLRAFGVRDATGLWSIYRSDQPALHFASGLGTDEAKQALEAAAHAWTGRVAATQPDTNVPEPETLPPRPKVIALPAVVAAVVR